MKPIQMKRRDFLRNCTVAGVGTSLPVYTLAGHHKSHNHATDKISQPAFKTMCSELLTQWCDGMIAHQIDDPKNSALHGALWCPACKKIHGRCMDAVYPFMYMADKTGDKKYLQAAIKVMDWSKNVDKPDGSWTVIPNPKSWAGITVFGAIALGEALSFHADTIPPKIKLQWTERLRKAAHYVYDTFNLTFTNINYGFTAIYALNMLGNLLDEPKYVARSHELAKGIGEFLTNPNKLIYGEGKPSNNLSDKGLLPVDLGYNVEETLNGLVLYALHEKDEPLLKLLEKSLASHLAFMLPDGAWDNSWGTRHAKWSYWGSLTTDGCQPAFGLMAHRHSAFGTAAYLSTKLLKRCTHNGLLHGGIHYQSHDVKPCIHHTFAHAKSLALMLDKNTNLDIIHAKNLLPRQTMKGVRFFPELDVWLHSSGPWIATVSTYDSIYKKHVQQGTGGAITMLWHKKVGPLMAASMAKYILVERNNQQDDPDNEDIALTPRIEIQNEQGWFTNIYDLKAQVSYHQKQSQTRFDVQTQLVNEDRETPKNSDSRYGLTYTFNDENLDITAHAISKSKNDPAQLTLPLISPAGEKVVQINSKTIEIYKPEGIVTLKSNAPIFIRKTKRARTFNLVPGMQAIVLDIPIANAPNNQVICTLSTS